VRVTASEREIILSSRELCIARCRSLPRCLRKDLHPSLANKLGPFAFDGKTCALCRRGLIGLHRNASCRGGRTCAQGSIVLVGTC
jgi:hypothetical protein